MHFKTSLAVAVAATMVSASPIERTTAKTAVMPLKQVVRTKTMRNVVNAGHARINKINQAHTVGASAQVSSGTVTNEDVTYVAPVTIGGNTWDLIVDTGCTLFYGCDQRTLY